VVYFAGKEIFVTFFVNKDSEKVIKVKQQERLLIDLRIVINHCTELKNEIEEVNIVRVVLQFNKGIEEGKYRQVGIGFKLFEMSNEVFVLVFF
jgi:hypothetical protein